MLNVFFPLPLQYGPTTSFSPLTTGESSSSGAEITRIVQLQALFPK